MVAATSADQRNARGSAAAGESRGLPAGAGGEADVGGPDLLKRRREEGRKQLSSNTISFPLMVSVTRCEVGGHLPVIISGGLSVLVGAAFISLAGLAERGAPRGIDVLVNNAAIGGPRRRWPPSVATRVAIPGTLAYAMTKGAINTFSVTLAQELGGRGITVNAVMPGSTATENNVAWFDAQPALREVVTGLSALRRVGEPADVADVVAFLASPAGRWVTGQVIDASGGTHLGLSVDQGPPE